ncbi:hypothetical protein GGU10DRAFT_231138, partial [Lentinula aff. detonsa]
LYSTSASFLVSNSPVQSTSQLPDLATTFISPKKRRFDELLSQQPRTQLESSLQEAMHWSNNHINNQKDWLLAMQAQNILQHLYTSRIRGQLQHSEEKTTQKNSRLHVDGRAKLLTQDEFFHRVKEVAERREREEADSSKRKAARVNAHERLATALVQWEQERRICEQRNKAVMERWELAVVEWENERDLARTERRKIGWTKP